MYRSARTCLQSQSASQPKVSLFSHCKHAEPANKCAPLHSMRTQCQQRLRLRHTHNCHQADRRTDGRARAPRLLSYRPPRERSAAHANETDAARWRLSAGVTCAAGNCFGLLRIAPAAYNGRQARNCDATQRSSWQTTFKLVAQAKALRT